MLRIIFVLFLGTYTLFCQQKTDSLSLKYSDSLHNIYIKDYRKQLNIKFEVSNEKDKYYFPFIGQTAEIVSNAPIRYSLGFNYKFVSVRLGIRHKPSQESKDKKGESDVFRLRVKLLFNKWSHRLEYNSTKGFYIQNTNIYTSTSEVFQNYIQFPSLTSKVFSGTSAYKFNPNYSVRAIESQTELQTKSAGTFMPGIDYWFYQIDGSQKIIDSDGNSIIRDKYNDYTGFSFLVNTSYFYTFVYRNHWYANVYAGPGLGMDLYQSKSYDTNNPSQTKHNSNLLLSFQSGASIGYGSDKYYFGARVNNKLTDEKVSKNDFKFQASKTDFSVFIGYRFKAPKTIVKPIDDLQQKVPILKDQVYY